MSAELPTLRSAAVAAVPREPVFVVTNAAARAIREFAARAGLARDTVARVTVRTNAGGLDFALEFHSELSPRRDILSVSNGIGILVRRTDAERVRGTLIDFVRAGERAGFHFEEPTGPEPVGPPAPVPPPPFPAVLDGCRHRIGRVPRWFWPWSVRYLRIPKPRWCNRSERLNEFFNRYEHLLRNGEVVWAHVVQANARLFGGGGQNHPGEVVFCPDQQADIEPDELAGIARAVSRLKATEPEEHHARKIARHLTNERTRAFGLPIPPSISPDRRCLLSTAFFVRKHLPEGRLCCPLLPVLVDPQAPGPVAILPSRYWPGELASWWTAYRRGLET